MTINEVIAYIMHTPENTNPAILRDLLTELSASSTGGNANVIELDIDDDIIDSDAIIGSKTNQKLYFYELSDAAAQQVEPFLVSDIPSYIYMPQADTILINNNSIKNSLIPVSQGWYIIYTEEDFDEELENRAILYNIVEADRPALADEYGQEERD